MPSVICMKSDSNELCRVLIACCCITKESKQASSDNLFLNNLQRVIAELK
jgi:hypothetical protein